MQGCIGQPGMWQHTAPAAVHQICSTHPSAEYLCCTAG
jgi:hypothetical protein